jgi:RNA polymerase sigma factor (TIGR02999 family)
LSKPATVFFQRVHWEDTVEEAPSDVTRLLGDIRSGNREALDVLLPLVYAEMRRIAAHALRGEREGHTLQPTALVHEAYLRMVGGDNVPWQNRAHFLGCAARVMRNVLVDHARAHRAGKRGGGNHRVTLTEALGLAESRDVDLVALDDALAALAEFDDQKSRIVEMRYFGGLSEEEVAEVLGVSERTVRRGWTMAKAWLRREMLRSGAL